MRPNREDRRTNLDGALVPVVYGKDRPTSQCFRWCRDCGRKTPVSQSRFSDREQPVCAACFEKQ
jgi:hypothetical protein